MSVDNFVFTVRDDNQFPRTKEIMLEQQRKDTSQIYSGKQWNIEYFFQRKRCELWLDDKTKQRSSIKKNNNSKSKLSTVDKLLLFNSPPHYTLGKDEHRNQYTKSNYYRDDVAVITHDRIPTDEATIPKEYSIG